VTSPISNAGSGRNDPLATSGRAQNKPASRAVPFDFHLDLSDRSAAKQRASAVL